MSLLRSCTAKLAAALESHQRFYLANLYTVTLLSGTVYRWTDWDKDLTYSSHTYTAMKIKRGAWSLTNSMSVPSMDLTIYAANETFGDGGTIKEQAAQGLFDGAEILHSRAYMVTPDDLSVYGVIDLNVWNFGQNVIGPTAVEATLNGKVVRLNGQAPKNLYQAGCIHSFCDDCCALAKADYTSSFTVGDDDSLSKTFIPWASAPDDYSDYKSGTLTFTSGNADGASRTISSVSSSGLTLAYPLNSAAAAGDSFTAFKGCQKTKAACTAYDNIQHWRAFPYTPNVEDGI